MSPKSNQFVDSLLTLTWQQDDKYDGYQLFVSKDSSFGVNAVDSIISYNNLKLSLDTGKYYWKVYSFVNNSIEDSTEVSSFNVFYPTCFDSLNLWLTSDTNNLVLVRDSFVYQWLDKSKYSNHTQPQLNPSVQPYYIKKSINGYNALRFEEPFCRFDLVNNLTSSNYSVFIVYKHLQNEYRRRILSNFSNWYMGINVREFRIDDSGNLAGKAVIQDQYVIHNAFAYQDTLYNFVNSQLYDKKPTVNSPGSTLRLGFDSPKSDFLEILMINDSISPKDRQSIDYYLMDKYAPPVNLGPNRVVCSFPDSLKLGIDYALDYQWGTGDTTDAIQVDSAGKYHVTITDMFGRESIDSVWYILDTVEYKADIKFSDTTICKGDRIEIIENSYTKRFSYIWNTSDTTPSILVDNEGLYKVSVRNCLGQTSVDSVRVNINQPEFSLGIDTTACFNQQLSLQADSNFSNVRFRWSTGSISNSIIADTTGEYLLTVTDQYNCVYSDSINVSIDSALFGVGLGPDTSLCEGNEVGLINPSNGITNYLWHGGDTTATITLDTAGIYILTFEDNRCQSKDTVVVTLKGKAPTADFSSSNFCFLDSVNYTDLSFPPSGDTIVDWKWFYGDGDSATTQNSVHFYPSADTFKTILQIQTDKGCVDTTSEIVVINPKPNAYFRYAGSLCAKSTVSYEDSSEVSRGSIAGYLWNFGDPNSQINSSNQEDPSHQYDTLGQYPVSLFIESYKGCRDTIVDTVDIAPTPNVAFTYNGLCLSDSTQFINQTVLAAGSISAYKWFFNTGNQNFQETIVQNPSIQFVDTGLTIITLRATSDEGCISVHRDSLNMRNNPRSNFNLTTYCEDALFTIIDQTVSQDSIIQYQWILEPNDTSFAVNPTFLRNDSGNYVLKQKVVSDFGCVDSTLKIVEVKPKPTANFTILNNGSGAPYNLRVSNVSSDATTYQWDLGNGATSIAKEPNVIYADTGDYQLSLTAISQFGCKDTLKKMLTVSPFLLEAILEDIFLRELFDGRLEVTARIANSGNNTINQLRLVATMNSEFQFAENVNETIFKGDRKAYQFNSTFLKGNSKKVDFVCVKIDQLNRLSYDAPDELCKKAFNNELKLEVFPNPTRQRLNLRYILPFEGSVEVDVYDQLGRRLIRQEIGNQQEGLYLVNLDVNQLRQGVYFLRFNYSGSSFTRTFIIER